ncbi:MAG: hypothetical protein J6O88_05935 [Chryseobacterium sp.]|uniref:hypothetical protein n=1 Tax=Chryseobacterium sp. TaxID=1871047 RepID=UPI001B012475|nr:hypothetical protein [Chryseobacterium sp.]MBO6184223.1 hypothetical protein [Chryseobacterium sp.]
MENMTTGVGLIATERQKQIEKHGFTGQYHLDYHEGYTSNQLSKAAVTLLMPDLIPNLGWTSVPENWDKEWFEKLMNKETKERLIIAGALIAAELDRLNALDKLNLQKCESCEKETDIDIMHMDSGSNWFCPECWKELSQVMNPDVNTWKLKAEKWDKLDEEIGKYYDNVPESSSEEEGDLLDIGEAAARAFKYL